ncbi:hypothetical protein Acy02nite_89120 [Actinoplanes cyaneus]|uniref:Uncharacterized protein n=1 Tax=Actinoplanes cyaneus TaxID=52696 RepID=A0A919MH89_9ACTN|nr:hypothetical protein Acy02nite_89120 [Actinoplanes cyaneus]
MLARPACQCGKELTGARTQRGITRCESALSADYIARSRWPRQPLGMVPELERTPIKGDNPWLPSKVDRKLITLRRASCEFLEIGGAGRQMWNGYVIWGPRIDCDLC